jgi:hypothetical protein
MKSLAEFCGAGTAVTAAFGAVAGTADDATVGDIRCTAASSSTVALERTRVASGWFAGTLTSGGGAMEGATATQAAIIVATSAMRSERTATLVTASWILNP